MDAYLEEELYDLLIYCLQNPHGPDFGAKRKEQKRSVVSCTQMEDSMLWRICSIQLNLESKRR